MIRKVDGMLKGLRFVAAVTFILSFVGCVFASDITQTEVREDITIWKLDTVKFQVFTKTAEITYRKGYMNGSDFVGAGGDKTILFMDVKNNPETPEDEAKTDFTDLIQAINQGNNIKNTITQAVKIKLGL